MAKNVGRHRNPSNGQALFTTYSGAHARKSEAQFPPPDLGIEDYRPGEGSASLSTAARRAVGLLAGDGERAVARWAGRTAKAGHELVKRHHVGVTRTLGAAALAAFSGAATEFKNAIDRLDFSSISETMWSSLDLVSTTQAAEHTLNTGAFGAAATMLGVTGLAIRKRMSPARENPGVTVSLEEILSVQPAPTGLHEDPTLSPSVTIPGFARPPEYATAVV